MAFVNRCASMMSRNNCTSRRSYQLFTKSRTVESMLKPLCNTNTKTSFMRITLSSAVLKKARVNITFVKHDGQKVTGKGREGDSLLDVVVNNELDIKGYGACEGTLSCSTCHLIFKKEDFNKLEEKATDEELDMLDLALDACETSRLGCQVTVTKDMEGLEVKVPADVRDAREAPDGPEPVTT